MQKKILLGAAVFSGIVGLIVSVGRIFDWRIITGLSMEWPTMKMPTSLSFILLGMVLWGLALYMWDENKSFAHEVILFSALPLAMLSLLLIFDNFSDSFSIAGIVFPEKIYDPSTHADGLPSLISMIVFLVISILALLTPLEKRYWRSAITITGLVMALAGIIALIGYATHSPTLFYSWSISGGMALNTALMFAILGFCIFYSFLYSKGELR